MQGQLELKKNPDKVNLVFRYAKACPGEELWQSLIAIPRVHKSNWLEAAASLSSKGNDLGKRK
jgi:hypothetical protein